ncbi:MAG: hypothetical protein OXI24_06020 [Candidatus Poribacteria bacterium]|nr:hypothetical protein [Candidatus Poribacteria bacterium]
MPQLVVFFGYRRYWWGYHDARLLIERGCIKLKNENDSQVLVGIEGFFRDLAVFVLTGCIPFQQVL